MSKNLLHGSILLADDDPDDAEMFFMVLKEVAPTVTFHHVKDGLAVFQFLKQAEHIPDVIFLDINMPEMTGWQCLTKLKGSAATKNIPVVIYSTSSHPLDKQTAIDLGATAFITKPSDYKILQKLLSAIAANLGNVEFELTRFR